MAWHGAFDLREEDRAEGVRRIGQVIELASHAEQEVQRLSRRRAEQTLAHWPRLTALLCLDNYGAEWRSAQSYLAPPLLEFILAAHFDLAEHADREVPIKTRQRFRKRIERLLDDVERVVGWPDELRRAIHRLLMHALTALREYEIVGPQAFTEELTTSMGVYARARAIIDNHRGDPLVRETLGVGRWMAKMSDWAESRPATVALLVGTGQILAQLATGIPPILLQSTPMMPLPSPSPRLLPSGPPTTLV